MKWVIATLLVSAVLVLMGEAEWIVYIAGAILVVLGLSFAVGLLIATPFWLSDVIRDPLNRKAFLAILLGIIVLFGMIRIDRANKEKASKAMRSPAESHQK